MLKPSHNRHEPGRGGARRSDPPIRRHEAFTGIDRTDGAFKKQCIHRAGGAHAVRPGRQRLPLQRFGQIANVADPVCSRESTNITVFAHGKSELFMRMNNSGYSHLNKTMAVVMEGRTLCDRGQTSLPLHGGTGKRLRNF
jgi:hypothetical protein